MFGAPFPGGLIPVTATLTNVANAANSGTFAVPASRSLVVLCFAAQTSPVSGVTGCIIGGHTATQIANNGSASNTCSMWAAMVDPSDPSTWSVSGISVFSGRSSAFIYKLSANRLNATANASSGAANPTATLNVPDASTYIGCAKAQGAASPGVSWSTLALDNTQSFSQQSNTCAHKNYASASLSQSATCSFSGSTGSAGVFGVFSP